MAVSLKHKFTSAKADSADTSLIRPSNWNDEHDLTMQGPAILGRYSTGNGVAQELTLGDGLSMDNAGVISAGTIAGRNLTVSSLEPTGGDDGDVHFQI